MKRPEDSLAEMIQALEQKTGKSLDGWRAVISQAGLTKHKEIVDHLKSQHGVTHGYANQIALNYKDKPAQEGDPVDAIYGGPKAALRPLRDALIAEINKFGNDVDLAPKKGYESVRRSKQFAIIQPSTATRLDLGINLKGVAPAGRLEESGSFNAMLSHRVRLSGMQDIDAELVAWMRRAYESA